MPTIQHYSKDDIQKGNYVVTDTKNTVLIQILDEDEGQFPRPPDEFKYVCRFIFEDTEDKNNHNAITNDDAKRIANILLNSYRNGWDVVVHCYAGVCRSSAVAIAGEKIGFTLEKKSRLPNELVMSKVVKELGVEDDSKSIKGVFMEKFLCRD
jgi:predicted protein tyrosine phosphatase